MTTKPEISVPVIKQATNEHFWPMGCLDRFWVSVDPAGLLYVQPDGSRRNGAHWYDTEAAAVAAAKLYCERVGIEFRFYKPGDMAIACAPATDQQEAEDAK